MRHWLRLQLFAPIALAIELPEIIAGLIALVGFLAIFFRPIVTFVAHALKWTFDHIYGIETSIVGFAQSVLALASSAYDTAVHALEKAGAAAFDSVANAAAAAAAAAGAISWSTITGYVQGAEHYVIGVAEDLYNRALQAVGAGDTTVSNHANDLYNRATAERIGGDVGVSSHANDLYNQSIAHADAVASGAAGVAQGLFDQAMTYTGSAVHSLEGLIAGSAADARAFATAAAAAAAGVVANTLVKTYDPCCNFLNDEIQPQWKKVKGLLGKLTRRGPLALVVLGAMAEAVTALDAKDVIRGVVEARRRDQGSSVAALKSWSGVRAA